MVIQGQRIRKFVEIVHFVTEKVPWTRLVGRNASGTLAYYFLTTIYSCYLSTQKDWTRLRETTIFKHQIPLPQSNSNVAKEMRIAIVLGILARLINTYIFQPTYLLEEDSGLRDVLRRQAIKDPKKESFTRGILLSMFPEEQMSEAKDRMIWVIEDLVARGGVQDVLIPDKINPFEKELENLLAQALEFWRSVQHSTQSLEPNFRYINDADLRWQTFEFQATEAREGEQSTPTVASEGLEDELYVIFPRMYSMKAEPQPIAAGTVLRKAQLRAAAQEVRETISHTSFTSLTSARHRSKPSRGLSISGQGTRGTTEKPFLSNAAASV